jgi:hypothetical protein
MTSETGMSPGGFQHIRLFTVSAVAVKAAYLPFESFQTDTHQQSVPVTGIDRAPVRNLFLIVTFAAHRILL